LQELTQGVKNTQHQCSAFCKAKAPGQAETRKNVLKI